MIRKISAQELRPGMYVADTGKSWLTHPYLYMTAGELNGSRITWLLGEGYTEAYIDLALCTPASLPPHLAALLKEKKTGVDTFAPPPPKVSLQEELPQARTVFFDSLKHAKDVMENVRSGKVDVQSAEPVVEGILESLDRNANALLGLCKLRQTDDYTFTHCVNTSVLAVMFARALGYSGDALHSIGLGALFHDIGKSLVPLTILNAPRKLTDEEMDVMRRHPELGYEQLAKQSGLREEVLQVTLEHHEHYDGGGYPRRLTKDDISIPGAIACIVDVFDALSSRRVYKDPMPLSKTLAIMYSMRGKEFFPDLVEKFIRLMGVYPVGSAIELEDGNLGVVSMANPTRPIQPKIVLVRDRHGRSLNGRECDLSQPGSPTIVKAVNAAELGVDPASVLGM